MGKYAGKKLLVLGSNVGAEDIVRIAKREGAKTYVTDWYPMEKSAAKRAADVPLFVSTNEADELEAIIRAEGIDGVLSGIHEFNILKAMELCERCSLPFYCSREQWQTIESKDGFRSLCKRYDVPCPETFYVGNDVLAACQEVSEYPVVLKPVDACASRGVHFCKDQEELRRWFSDALACSSSGLVIIEERCRGNEFTAHYVISGGRAALACIDDRYPVAVHEGSVTTIPIARIYPNMHIDRYLDVVNDKMVNLCEGIGLKDAVMFIQGLYDESRDVFNVFEAGLRSAAEAPFRFLDVVNGTNYAEIVVDHALLGESDYSIEREDPKLNGYCCGVVSCVGTGGVVAEVNGFDEASVLDGVITSECRYPVGAEIPDGDTLRQLAIRFVIASKDRKQMAEVVRRINSIIEMNDEKGSTLIKMIDPVRIECGDLSVKG